MKKVIMVFYMGMAVLVFASIGCSYRRAELERKPQVASQKTLEYRQYQQQQLRKNDTTAYYARCENWENYSYRRNLLATKYANNVE